MSTPPGGSAWWPASWSLCWASGPRSRRSPPGERSCCCGWGSSPCSAASLRSSSRSNSGTASTAASETGLLPARYSSPRPRAAGELWRARLNGGDALAAAVGAQPVQRDHVQSHDDQRPDRVGGDEEHLVVGVEPDHDP